MNKKIKRIKQVTNEEVLYNKYSSFGSGRQHIQLIKDSSKNISLVTEIDITDENFGILVEHIFLKDDLIRLIKYMVKNVWTEYEFKKKK